MSPDANFVPRRGAVRISLIPAVCAGTLPCACEASSRRHRCRRSEVEVAAGRRTLHRLRVPPLEEHLDQALLLLDERVDAGGLAVEVVGDGALVFQAGSAIGRVTLADVCIDELVPTHAASTCALIRGWSCPPNRMKRGSAPLKSCPEPVWNVELRRPDVPQTATPRCCCVFILLTISAAAPGMTAAQVVALNFLFSVGVKTTAVDGAGLQDSQLIVLGRPGRSVDTGPTLNGIVRPA